MRIHGRSAAGQTITQPSAQLRVARQIERTIIEVRRTMNIEARADLASQWIPL